MEIQWNTTHDGLKAIFNIDVPLVIPHSKKNPRSRFFFCRNVARYPWLESHYLQGRLGEMNEGLLFRISGGIKHVYLLKKRIENEILCNSIWICI